MRVSCKAVAAAAAFVLVTGLAGVDVVEAGPAPPVISAEFTVTVAGSQVANAATYVPTITPAGSGGQVGDCAVSVVVSAPYLVTTEYVCDLLVGDTYTISVPTPPAPHRATYQCGTTGVSPTDQLDLTGEPLFGGCFIGVVAPTVFVEKVVLGDETGPLTSDEFVLTVHPADGGAAVGSDSDPDEAFCDLPTDIGVLCGYIEVPTGDYAIGEEREYGYVPAIAECRPEPFAESEEPPPIIIDPEIVPLPPERIDDPSGEPIATFTLDDDVTGFVFCAVGNFYAEGEITIAKTVTNNHGGTAGPEDWTVELYDDTNMIVDEAVCNPDGSCLSGTYPVGQYTIGERGPEGYTSTLTIEITEDAPLEALADPDATFDLEPFAIVDATIASEDQPTSTSSTSTTTTSTTTTVADSTTTTVTSTTVAPVTTAGPTTTAFDVGGVTLPPTGSDSGTSSLALAAALFVLLGGAALVATRRR